MRRTMILLAACSALGVAVGCNHANRQASDVEVELSLDPSPPVVGDAAVAVELTTAGGEPLEGAQVRLEGNMNHAGMKPSFADLEEESPGRYAGTLEFTMGGDWFILVTATTQGGDRVEKKIDVRGVKRP